MLLAYRVGLISIVLVIGPYVLSLVGAAGDRRAEPGLGMAATALAAAVAVAGARPAARLQWVLIGIEYAGIGVLAVAALATVLRGGGHSVPLSWSWFSWHTMNGSAGFLSGILIAVFMYGGWDRGRLLNAEAAHARARPRCSAGT